MSSSDQPGTDSSSRARTVTGGMRLLEVLLAVLVLGGIVVYVLAHYHRPHYSDDPRVDRAVRELVAYCPRVNLGPRTSPLTSVLGNGSSSGSSGVTLTSEDWHKFGWLLSVSSVLGLRSELEQSATQG